MDSCFRRNDSYSRFPIVPALGSNRGHSWLDQESRMRKSIVTMKYKKDTITESRVEGTEGTVPFLPLHKEV